ncbi:FAD:protein FMN transferase [Lutibacter oricola]|uniref:FAD:protein FMN transferase n=1 Tax=Lutibacter oricola TaxID=762486 RepID=UPI001587C7B1|nr:FAD:protein FMN transferase [Lutibacter oricola]
MYKKVLLVIAVFSVLSSYAKKFSYNENKLGGNFKLVFYTSEKSKADLIAKQSYLLVDSLNEILSSYIKSSKINRLNKKGKLKNTSVELLQVIEASQIAFKKTNGYFDISVKPLMDFWNKAEKRKRLPSNKCLQKKAKTIGLNSVLNINNKEIFLKRKSKLDINGIAKGYIIDEVFNFLKSKNISNFLVEAAGDIRVSGKPEGSDLWVVGVSASNSKNYVVSLKSGQAIATSGNTYRYRVIEGKKYSHIINPKTATPITHNVTSSVIAKNATTADYLASTFNVVIAKNEIEKILNNYKDVEILLFNNNGTIFETNNFLNNKL